MATSTTTTTGSARIPARRAVAGEVHVGHVATPIGRLLVAATPAGLVRIAFERESPDAVLAELRAGIGRRIVDEGALVDVPRTQLEAYFAGTLQEFTMPLDLSSSTGFRRSVLEHMFRIPYGTTITYAELARRAGNGRAARAAGHACATNPIPIVVPCHRVLGSDGGLHGYGGGLHVKQGLLRLEGVIIA